MNSTWTRRGILVAAVVALVWMSGGLSERWFGQTLAAPEGEQPKVPATTVAMMDIAYIFKNHKDFNKDMKALEQEANTFQQNMQATDARLQLLLARVKQTEDKTEKEKLEDTLAAQATEFQVSVRKTQQDISDREARLYYGAYMLLQEQTKKYCRARGIHVVLKFNRDPVTPSDRKSVTEGLAHPVVFSDAPDISDDILKAMDAAATVKGAKKSEETKSR